MEEISGYYSKDKNVFPSNVSSSSNQMFIEFKSDEWWGSKGFKAKIHVELKYENLSVDACTMQKPCQIHQGHCQSDDECKGILKCGYSNCPAEQEYHQQSRCCYDYCSKWLDMENGTLMSPWFPDYYPGKLRCQTLITVGMTIAGPRTITLEFLHFKVCNKHPVFCKHFFSRSNPILNYTFFSCKKVGPFLSVKMETVQIPHI